MIELGPLGLVVAFGAGFVSFSSPCVFPLVPGYLAFVSGVGFSELGARTGRVVASTATFVAGFTAMFVALGIGAAWFGTVLLANRRPLEIAAGALVILAALTFVGLPLPRFLVAERRLELTTGGKGLVTAALAGVAFAVAWTPCIGPTLAAILTLAATQGDASEGAALLGAYSLGLGVPFLLFGLLFTQSMGLVGWLRRHWRVISLGSAAVLVAFGALLISGDMVRITARLSSFAGWLI